MIFLVLSISDVLQLSPYVYSILENGSLSRELFFYISIPLGYCVISFLLIFFASSIVKLASRDKKLSMEGIVYLIAGLVLFLILEERVRYLSSEVTYGIDQGYFQGFNLRVIGTFLAMGVNLILFVMAFKNTVDFAEEQDG